MENGWTRKLSVNFLLWVIPVFQFVCGCEFPYEWQGHWYQSIVGEITISKQNITKKGVCLESHNEFYLLENRDIGCYTCLRITQRHANVLQYQESFCVGKGSLHHICASIQLETMVNTLIREPALPSPCPFQWAYHFTYMNNSGGMCRSPASYSKPCASEAKTRFHFKHCPDAAYTYAREVDMKCLADWKEGSDRYLYIWLQGNGFYAKEERYRCLSYSVLGTLIHVAMSADASCRGLRSSRDGPIVIELTQDVFGWPEPACSFPTWLTRTRWRDLSGHHLYVANTKGDVIRASFRPNAVERPEIEKAFRCHRVLNQNTTIDQFTIVGFISHGCASKYQCLKFIRRKDGVVEVHEGEKMEYDTYHCSAAEMHQGNKRLLMSDTDDVRKCPYLGRFPIETGTEVCSSFFRSGCNSSSVVDIISSCSSKAGLQLECLKTWREDGKRYLIARKPGEASGSANCFSFRRKGNSLLFSADASCNIGTPYILRDAVTYVLGGKKLECNEPYEMRSIQSDNHSAQKEYPDEELRGSYKHIDESQKARDHRTRHILRSRGAATFTQHIGSVLTLVLVAALIVQHTLHR